MSENNMRTITATSTDPSYKCGPPTLRTPHTTVSVTSAGNRVLLMLPVADDHVNAARDELLGLGWTDIQVHEFVSVAEAWFKAKVTQLRGIEVYTIGQEVTSWYGTDLRGSAVMTRRDDLNPGDQFHSSHWGRMTVHEVHSKGLTTTIQGTHRYEHEAYDRHMLIPVYS